MANTGKAYLPAAGHDWALPLYDAFVRLIGLDRTRDTLLEQAQIERTHQVLEIGCGTGTLLTRLKHRYPDATAIGLDPDPKALARARRKAEAAGLSIQFDEGFADRLPYPVGSFDRVLSSFMFHHLSSEAKAKTMHEVRRVLRAGGSFHLLDFAASGEGERGFLMRLFHSDSALADNAQDRVVARMQEAGFRAVERLKREALFFGHLRLDYYRAGV